MAATFTGVQAEELESTKRYNPRTGDTIIRHWKGEPTQIDVIELQARLLKYAYSTGWDGGYKTISVEYPESSDNDPNTPLSEKWECDSNYLQKDVWALPAVQTELAKIGTAENPQVRGFFRNDLESLARGNPVTIGEDGEETTVTLSVLQGVAELYNADWAVLFALFGDLTKGVTTYEVEQYVVRHTKVTNQSSSIIAARENVGRIFTAGWLTPQLPSDVKFEAPTTGFWLKRIPRVDQIERGKWEIVQEYWHADEYSTLLYGEPVA